MLPLDEVDDRAAQLETGCQRQIGGGGPDLHADVTGLHHAAQVCADVRELLGGEPEDYRPALAGLEVQSPEAA